MQPTLLDITIRRMLEMHPRGVSNAQLLWRLRSSGVRVSPSDLLDGLNALVQRGEIRRNRDGRWSAYRGPAIPKDAEQNRRQPGAVNASTLYAAAASQRPISVTSVPDVDDEAPDTDDRALPEMGPLLSYYAATQRQDPRGRIEEYPDRHGKVWQLFHARGHWWSDCELTIPMDRLPDAFRESLFRRDTSSAAIGWPVSVFVTPAGTACLPALLVPVSWRIDGADLRVQPESVAPSVNPSWLRQAAKHSNWSEELLGERLLDTEDQGLAAIGDRIRHALATLGAAQLRPGDLAMEMSLVPQGIHNAAALFLSEDASFTKGAAADLEALAGMSPSALAATALATILQSHAAAPDPVPPIPVSDLTETQLTAAEAALGSALTVIQGPPGTGKSQVILNLLASAVLNGRSVLFAAKNHQALDEVERRLQELVPDDKILVRGRDADGERNVSFLDVLNELAREASASPQTTQGIVAQNATLLASADGAAKERGRVRRLERVHLALSELVERPTVAEPGKARTVSPMRRWLRAVLRLFRRGDDVDPLTALPEDATPEAVAARRSELSSLIFELTAGDAEARAEQPTAKTVREHLARYASAVTKPSSDEWQQLSDRSRDLEFNRARRASALSPEDARAVVRYRPIWVMSTLSVPARIPLVPGLFDFVIFDEASQCDVASALPLLARARQAVVVGDPMQLRFIPSLSNRTEHALMDAAGLPKVRRFDFAQSSNSLFDFANRRPIAARHFLRDQFRSAPEIVDYLNADFYRGRLVNRREDDQFAPPAGYKPGLAWEDVQGHASRDEDGTTNAGEALRISEMLGKLADDASFTGTVGVLSLFNAQVARIQREVNAALTVRQRERLALRIATVDKFQGGEADVIFFSLVLTSSAQSSARIFLERERRRLNVAISRARAVCIVVGDLTYARRCGIKHLQYLAERASGIWSAPRPPFDSLWERRLDTALRARGMDPIPQYAVGSKYLDFALDPDGARINVEVDGRRWHLDRDGERKVSDRQRDAEMKGRGWHVMRFWVHELADDMGGCIDRIERELERRRTS